MNDKVKLAIQKYLKTLDEFENTPIENYQYRILFDELGSLRYYIAVFAIEEYLESSSNSLPDKPVNDTSYRNNR